MILILILSILVFYVDIKRTSWNMWNMCNGYGSIASVLDGTAKQPMCYRVLIPWLVGGHNKLRYLIVKYLSILFALTGAYLWIGESITILSIFFMVAAEYDYTENYLEVGFFGIAFYLLATSPQYMSIYLAILIIIATLNRETSIFIVIAAILGGADVLLLVAYSIGIIIPRVIYGWKHERYCEAVLIKKNLKNIKEGKFLPEYILFGLLTLAMVVAPLIAPFGTLEATMYLMYVALLIPAMWLEIRVFSPVILILIPMFVK